MMASLLTTISTSVTLKLETSSLEFFMATKQSFRFADKPYNIVSCLGHACTGWTWQMPEAWV